MILCGCAGKHAGTHAGARGVADRSANRPSARTNVIRRAAKVATVAAAAALLMSAPAAAADEAQGTIHYTSRSGPISVTVKHAYLVKGPDTVTDKIVRRIVLSPDDLAPKLRTCATMICGDGDMEAGLTIDLDVGPRLNYWFVADGQRIQYSGTAVPSTLKLTTDTPQRMAGTWEVDDSAAGGPRAQIIFDATLLKVFTKAH